MPTCQSEGHAKIHSELDRGTSVRFYLPRYRGELDAQTPPQEIGSVQSQTAFIILVVEDEPVVRQLIVEVLQGQGYQTLQAADGGAASLLLLALSAAVVAGGVIVASSRTTPSWATALLPNITTEMNSPIAILMGVTVLT